MSSFLTDAYEDTGYLSVVSYDETSDYPTTVYVPSEDGNIPIVDISGGIFQGSVAKRVIVPSSITSLQVDSLRFDSGGGLT